MLLVGVYGKKRHGKNTVCNIIQDYEDRNTATIGIDVKQGAFADPLKDEVAALLVMYSEDKDGFEDWCQANLGPEWFNAFVDVVVCREVDFGVYHIVRDALDNDHLKDTYFRKLLQTYGTEFRRAKNEAYWLLRAMTRIVKAKEEDRDAYVLTDTRFENEIDFLALQGGMVVKVVRPGLDNGDGHASETALDAVPDDAYDAVFVNDGTLHDLETKVLDWWKKARLM